MEIKRRQFLKATGALASLSLLPSSSAILAGQASHLHPNSLLASSCSNLEGEHFIALLSSKRELSAKHRVPTRGHAAVASPDSSVCVFFSRRPGKWAMVVEAGSGIVLAKINAENGRHFYGHGVFSHDGTLLYAMENDYDNSRGVIGIYSVAESFKRVGEMPSYGIGPHELILLPNRNILVVANGGILTHPETGRIKLNLDTMESKLTYIDLESGQEIQSQEAPHSKLSLRHLASTPDGLIVVGAQFEGQKNLNPNLVFGHRLGEELTLFSGQSFDDLKKSNHYVASVSISASGTYAATSDPRGDRVSIWRISDRVWLGDVELSDIGGLSFMGTRDLLWLSSGNGSIYLMDLNTWTYSRYYHSEELRWDNHLTGG